jgi:heat shock protein HtpX
MWFGGGDGEDRERNVIVELALMILAPFAAMLLQLALSRQREYAADATGARMVGNQFGLISALQKLGTYNQRIPTSSISQTTSSLCIVKPMFGISGASALFSTHPPLEKRIEALREMTVVPKR